MSTTDRPQNDKPIAAPNADIHIVGFNAGDLGPDRKLALQILNDHPRVFAQKDGEMLVQSPDGTKSFTVKPDGHGHLLIENEVGLKPEETKQANVAASKVGENAKMPDTNAGDSDVMQAGAGVENWVPDFWAGAVHGAVENPVNGVIKILNHSDVEGPHKIHLPEMHLAKESSINSVAGKVGAIAGSGAEILALSAAAAAQLGVIGGAHAVGTQAINTAAMGAAGDAAATGTEVTAMAAESASSTAGALTPAVGLRMLSTGSASAVYGATMGVAAGVLHGEANGVIKDGKPSLTLNELGKDGTESGVSATLHDLGKGAKDEFNHGNLLKKAEIAGGIGVVAGTAAVLAPEAAAVAGIAALGIGAFKAGEKLPQIHENSQVLSNSNSSQEQKDEAHKDLRKVGAEAVDTGVSVVAGGVGAFAGAGVTGAIVANAAAADASSAVPADVLPTVRFKLENGEPIIKPWDGTDAPKLNAGPGAPNTRPLIEPSNGSGSAEPPEAQSKLLKWEGRKLVDSSGNAVVYKFTYETPSGAKDDYYIDLGPFLKKHPDVPEGAAIRWVDRIMQEMRVDPRKALEIYDYNLTHGASQNDPLAPKNMGKVG